MQKILLVMGFRNRSSNSLRPVHRIKHVVDIQNATTAGTTVTETLIKTVDAPVLANTTEVETGSKCNGIYLKVEVNATNAAGLPNVYLSVFKNPGAAISMAAPNVVGSFDNKRYVIHQEMVMLQGVTNSNPRTLFNGVIAIPRGYRRNGPEDQLQAKLLAPGVNLNYCIQCHYKEFR